MYISKRITIYNLSINEDRVYLIYYRNKKRPKRKIHQYAPSRQMIAYSICLALTECIYQCAAIHRALGIFLKHHILRASLLHFTSSKSKVNVFTIR